MDQINSFKTGRAGGKNPTNRAGTGKGGVKIATHISAGGKTRAVKGGKFASVAGMKRTSR